jgi:hypothetical protein
MRVKAVPSWPTGSSITRYSALPPGPHQFETESPVCQTLVAIIPRLGTEMLCTTEKIGPAEALTGGNDNKDCNKRGPASNEREPGPDQVRLQLRPRLARPVAQTLPNEAAQRGGRDEGEEWRPKHRREEPFSPVIWRALAQEQRGQQTKEEIRDEDRQRVGGHGSAPFKGGA